MLKPGGEILVKYYQDDYFSWMLDELKDEKRFKLELKTFDLHTEAPEHFLSSFVTKFEKIFLEKNVKIKALTLKSLK